jgi:hypothetical protein
LDLRFRETARGRNGDALILVRSLVLGTDVDDTVGINVKGDFDLGDTTGCRRETNELEVSEEFVVLDEFSFTLEDFDFDSSLAIGGSGEDLGLFGGDGGVAVDETGEDTAEGFNTEGEGSDVEEEDIGDIAGQDGSLDGSTNGDGFIGVDGFSGISLEESLDGFINPGRIRNIVFTRTVYLGIRVMPPTRMTSLI